MNYVSICMKGVDKMKCYGCDREIGKDEKYYRMRVEHEKRKQVFCEECYKRLAKIKLGLL